MFFEQIRKRFFRDNKEKSNSKKKKRPTPSRSQDKAELERQIIKKADNLIAERKFQTALNVINLSIKDGISSNQILFKKALALSKNNQFQEAHEIWTKLSKLENKPKLAASAQQSLDASKKIEIQTINSTRQLINELHTKANQYNQKLQHIPKANNWSPKIDIIPLVIKEAEIIRNAELPKLSTELIDKVLLAGLESPLLVNEKALAIGMMGQKPLALEILVALKKTIQNEKLVSLINKNISHVKSNITSNQSKINRYLAKQARAITSGDKLITTFLPEDEEINGKTKIKFLVFRKARSILTENPKSCLHLINSILDYFPGDLAALLLKGEALAALGKNDAAFEICKGLANSKDENIAYKATELIGYIFSEKALEISTKESPQNALTFYIEQHLKHSLGPTINNNIKSILQKLEPPNTQFADPELQRHQFQLALNTHLIKCVEARLRERNRPNIDSPAQKPGAISKTAPKAG